MLTNKHGLPDTIADAMQPRPYVGCGGSDYSATSLIRSPRQVQLERRYKKDIEEDLVDHWSFFMGNAIHSALERELDSRYPTRYLVERKVTRCDLDRRVVMKVDVHDIEKQLTIDHKTSKIGARANSKLWTEFKEDWKKQLMINAFFLEEEGFPVKELAINQIFLDWKPFTASVKSADDYPKTPVVELKIHCPPQEERRKYYMERLQFHIDHENTPDDELPLCTPEECWESPGCWAVQSKNTGAARKCCDTKEEADVWLLNNLTATTQKSYEVVERKGGRMKCEAFCSVNKFCNQYKEWKDGRNS